MREIAYNRKPRIQVVDAIRGFALLGILLLHSIEHYDFLRAADMNPAIFAPLDPYVDRIIRFLFAGKAYSMFSIMFGLSFFIQMDRQEQRGVDFRRTFLWRLAILFVFGYLHGLIYSGDILKIYAVLGVPLVLLYNRNNKFLLGLALLIILQVPTIYNLIYSFLHPEYVFDRSILGSLWGQANQTFGSGTFLEVVRFNAWKGIMAVWAWMYFNGRYLQLIGFFILGLLIGKSRYFENVGEYSRQTKHVLGSSVLVYGILLAIGSHTGGLELTNTQAGLLGTLINSYSNFALTFILMTSFVLVYQRIRYENKFSGLAAYGKMSLTSYVTQGVIGAPFFYGYGLAMYHYFGHTMSIIYGVLFFLIQISFCRIWLRYYNYGPLEWLWRAITYFDFDIAFRKIRPAVQSIEVADSSSV
ncbi:MAG: DUF418 domain-containing protein [Candidatus Marinimicrobia bacterium]|nr:DUF418 domain-containing protein [Candidatus Neomarinimicrobiota bacterium]MCF7880470.1 DUF418 domain-containing protein [Candidatus Neomarinimicrobiota bacterium]